jgi:hypothetical protein
MGNILKVTFFCDRRKEMGIIILHWTSNPSDYKYDLASHLAVAILALSYGRRVGRNSQSYKIKSSTLTPTAEFRFVNTIILGLYNQNTCM